ncbi:MAG: hypothetical protein MUO77_13980 [Anaerolineales bacterium]|nr:hypothetical protein [Anaerolineales bacterium]
MQNINHFVHAYRIAPWRIQRQWIGNTLLVVVGFAMVAALYLYVTARAAIAGREIQDLTASTRISQQASADLQTRFAALTSTSVMEERALALGFEPIKPGRMEYIVVAGYMPPQPVILSNGPQSGLRAPSIPPEYNQSLLDWMDEQVHSPYVRGGLQQ